MQPSWLIKRLRMRKSLQIVCCVISYERDVGSIGSKVFTIDIHNDIAYIKDIKGGRHAVGPVGDIILSHNKPASSHLSPSKLDQRDIGLLNLGERERLQAL